MRLTPEDKQEIRDFVLPLVREEIRAAARPIPRRLLRVIDVADILGVSTWSVYRLVDEHKLEAVKIHNSLRFDPEDVRRYVERGKG